MANISNQKANETVNHLQPVTQSLGCPGCAAIALSITDLNALVIIYLILSALGFVLNIFTIVIIRLHKPMHKHLANAFIVNQSLMDAVASIFVFLSTIYEDNFVGRKAGILADELFCRVWFSQAVMYGMFVSSTYGIVALTFERFCAVVHPFWHRAHFRGRKVAVIFISVWVFGPIYNFAMAVPTSFIDQNGICRVYGWFSGRATEDLLAVVSISVSFLFPLSCLVYLYYRMVMTLRGSVTYRAEGPEASAEREIGTTSRSQHLKIENCGRNATTKRNKTKIGVAVIIVGEGDQDNEILSEAKQSGPSTAQMHGDTSVHKTKESGNMARETSDSRLKAKRTVLKTLIIVGAGFVLCYSWNSLYFTVFHFGYPAFNFTGVFFNFTVLMNYVGCCINPVIYCIQYTPFQKALRAVFCRPRPASVSIEPAPLPPTVKAPPRLTPRDF